METPVDYLEIKIDDAKHLLYGKWLRDVTNDEYKAGLRYMYQLIVKHEIVSWLQNSEYLLPRNVGDQKWIAEEFAVLVMQSSVKYMAVVVPKTSAHYAVLSSIREKAYRIFGRSKLVELFETNEEALAWLTPNLQHYRLPNS